MEKIKISKKGNKYIGIQSSHDTIKWQCKACLNFMLEKDIVGGTGEFICKKCLMNDNYLKVIK